MEASVTELKVRRNYTQLYLSRGRWPEKEKRRAGYAKAEILREREGGSISKGRKETWNALQHAYRGSEWDHLTALNSRSQTIRYWAINNARTATHHRREGGNLYMLCLCQHYFSFVKKIPNHGMQIKKPKKGGGGVGGQIRVAIQSNKGACVAICSICVSSWGGGGEGMPHPPQKNNTCATTALLNQT